MCGKVLHIASLVAVLLVADGARVALFSAAWLLRLDEVGERPAPGEHAPVVRVVLVDVLEEALLVGTVLLTHLTDEIHGPRQL